MGMYNAIIDDELLNPIGVFKERLSQSALVARMRTISPDEARAVRQWLDKKGVRFVTGKDENSELDRRADSRTMQDVYRRRPHRG